MPGVVRKFNTIRNNKILNKSDLLKLKRLEKGEKITNKIQEIKIKPTNPNFIKIVTKKLWARE